MKKQTKQVLNLGICFVDEDGYLLFLSISQSFYSRKKTVRKGRRKFCRIVQAANIFRFQLNFWHFRRFSFTQILITKELYSK